MAIWQDIYDTWRLGRNAGANWRAVHARSAMCLAPCFCLAAVYFMLHGGVWQARSVAFLALGAAMIGYWSHQLPRARRSALGKIPAPPIC